MILCLADLSLSEVYDLRSVLRQRHRAAEYCGGLSEKRLAATLSRLDEKISDHIYAHYQQHSVSSVLQQGHLLPELPGARS